MTLILSHNVQSQSAQAVILCHPNVLSLAQWVQHYQAETVDMRYFFHSGWSS